jgi:hypothetical protein
MTVLMSELRDWISLDLFRYMTEMEKSLKQMMDWDFLEGFVPCGKGMTVCPAASEACSKESKAGPEETEVAVALFEECWAKWRPQTWRLPRRKCRLQCNDRKSAVKKSKWTLSGH